MNLVVVGAGYVGLVTAAVFADLGQRVRVVENQKEKVAQLLAGKIPFYEPGLGKLVLKNVRAKRLVFTTDYAQAVSQAAVIFICVGTPTVNGKIDLSYLYAATKSVAQNLSKPAVIVIKSTVTPGINQKIKERMEKYTKIKLELASVPEFLREGRAIADTLRPYRVVIGADKKSVAQILLKLHRKIAGERLVCDPVSAQMIKYAANAFLPTKISFANSVAVLCDKVGADITKVMLGVGLDKRIGPDFLGAGLGYGGSCFPKDVAALVNLAKKTGSNFRILQAVEKTNQDQVDYFVQKAVNLAGGSVKNKIMVVLGLAFKPETSDMREARSIYVIQKLKELGALIHACDPVAIPEAQKIITGVKYFSNPYEALKNAAALLLVTEWPEYQKLDFKKIKKLMATPVVLDGRNVYNRAKLEKLGFVYGGIGR